MASEQNPSFDPKAFLAKVGEGRSIDKYRKDQIVFSQGRKRFFTSSKARSSSLSFPSMGRKQSSRFLKQTISAARGAWPDSRSA